MKKRIINWNWNGIINSKFQKIYWCIVSMTHMVNPGNTTSGDELLSTTIASLVALTGIDYSWQYYVGRLVAEYNNSLLDNIDRYRVLVT